MYVYYKMTYYTCDICEVKPMKNKAKWIEHQNTKKHKKNIEKSTCDSINCYKCLNCHSHFIYDHMIQENNKEFNEHMKTCKKNIINQITESSNHNDSNTDNITETKNDLIEKINELEKEIQSINKLKKENDELKEKNKYVNDYEKENIKLKEEVKYMDKLERENSDLKKEVKLLNDKIQIILIDSKTEVKQVMANSNNDIKETRNDIMKICGEQMNFAQTVSKDSNKITSSAMTLIGFLQKQCPDNKKATGFLISG